MAIASLIDMPAYPPAHSLKNLRRSRYCGEDVSVELHEFSLTDQRLLRAVYAFLEGLVGTFQPFYQEGTAEARVEATAQVADLDLDGFIREAGALGRASIRGSADLRLGKAVHDLRGGALTALLGELQIARLFPEQQLPLRQLYFLTRDHLKIMRNAVVGLDDAKRRNDLAPRSHRVELITEKWQRAVLGVDGQRTRLQVHADFEGGVAECCLEFGALDRVLYNFIRPACQLTASGEINLTISGQPATDVPKDVCFCVSNPLRPSEESAIADRLRRRGAFISLLAEAGNDFGPAIALDFVMHAYGLYEREQALHGGYLGQACSGGELRAWFHWPVAGTTQD